MYDIDAVICDLDGTLVDTEELHLKAWYDSVAAHGHHLPDGWEHHYIGNPDIDWAVHCVRTYSPMPDAETLLRERHARYQSLLGEHGEKTAFPGVKDELVKLRERGFKLAVGTNSPLENTTCALRLAGIEHFFPVVVAYGMTPRGKPFPDIFLAAAEWLGVDPRRAVVLEDSAPGIRAGKEAGAMVLALATTNPPEALTEADMLFPATREAMRWVGENCRPSSAAMG